MKVERASMMAIRWLLASAAPPAAISPCLRSIARTLSTLSDGQLTACLAETRAVVLLQGQDVVPFLQGMVSNDVKPLTTPGTGPVYACLLTPKGKFLHDIILYQHPAGGDRLLMEVDAAGKDQAMDWLERYTLRKRVEVRDMSGAWSVWARFGRAQAPVGEPPGWWTDPRLPALGLRAVLPHDLQPPPNDPTASISSPAELYRQWRYEHGVPEGETEIPTGKAAPLDYNLDVLNGISYRKGCYIGQERNSFTHFRGVIRRRCMPFRVLPGGQQAPPAEGVIVDASGAVAGTIQGVSGSIGLAHMKLRPALQCIEGGVPLKVASSGASIQPFRPRWWPEEWGHEEGDGAEPSAGPS